MDIEQVEAVAHAEMAARKDQDFREPGWILYHGKRTGKIAVHLAGLIECSIDLDCLYVAGLFHDVGKGQDDHNEVGARRTRELLAGLLSEDDLDGVCETIRLHNQRKTADDFSEQLKLIQDADLVDHAGSIDVWSTLYYGGSQGESMHDRLAYLTGDDCRQSRDYMRTHMNFDVSLKMFDQRTGAADRFFAELHRTYFEGM